MTQARQRIKRYISPLAYGSITGAIVGATLVLFLILSRIVINFTFGLYKGADGALCVVCILILTLLCCFLTALIQTLCPAAKGSGIPLAEGTARGMLRVKWLAAAAGLVAGSLLAFLSGMPLGSEGPSIGVGGLIGEGVGKAAKKPVEFRRYLITGGACAGLATAFNAPLTGLCFAFEETHRRFSPYIMAASLSAVVVSVLVSQAAFYGFSKIPYLSGLGVKAGFCLLPFLKQTAYKTVVDCLKMCGVALICGGACAGLGIGFNRLTAVLNKLFNKIKNAALRLLPAFLLVAVAGLPLYLSVGSGEASVAEITTDSAFWLIATVLIIRFVTTSTASGASATGGLFLPMIAVGGLTGTIIAKISLGLGLDGAYAANVTVMCISAFFAASVRAPITAIALSVELTASFVNLLPCVIAIAAATIIADLANCEPLYERMLHDLVSSAPLGGNAKSLKVRGRLRENSVIAHRRVRDIMWPYNSLVTELYRDGKELVPDGETILEPNDEIVIRAENVDTDMFYAQLREYISIDSDTASPSAPKKIEKTIESTAHNIYKL